MKCSFCKKRAIQKDGSFVFLGGGALFMQDKKNGGPHEKMEALFDVGIHGGQSTPDVIHHIDTDQSQGQFEINFCSTKCLRKFFDKIVDKLETKKKKENR